MLDETCPRRTRTADGCRGPANPSETLCGGAGSDDGSHPAVTATTAGRGGRTAVLASVLGEHGVTAGDRRLTALTAGAASGGAQPGSRAGTGAAGAPAQP